VNSQALQTLLEAVADGTLKPDAALENLKHLAFEPVTNDGETEFARIDHHRSLRTGFPEVIWGPGKTPEQIGQIMQVMRDSRSRIPHGNRDRVVMATRIDPEVYLQLDALLPGLVYYRSARICATAIPPAEPEYPGTIGVVCAGTADLPVAEEAAVTAELCGFRVQRLWDVGVAGIHRLLANRHILMECDVLIVVAGMEGALPSVVAGLVEAPAIAVPTSIGYGASFNGLAALLGMLNSCASGLGVVNIDNGFGAAMLAAKILRTRNSVS
jgi:hypothetical protein